MTVTPLEKPVSFTTHCGDTTCRHPICRICGKGIRRNNEKASSHPGTVRGKKGIALCHRHEQKILTEIRRPALSDYEMLVLKNHYPDTHRLISDRRSRDIPPQGLIIQPRRKRIS